MSVDWQASLYDPIYEALGVDAVITPKTLGIAKGIRAIDKTSGAVVDATTGGGRQVSQVQLQTIRPCADVRCSELDSLGLSLDQLADSSLSLNGSTWTVKTHAQRPGPEGENSGEVRLILIDETA